MAEDWGEDKRGGEAEMTGLKVKERRMGRGERLGRKRTEFRGEEGEG